MISIITPAYNCKKYIYRLYNSLVSQTDLDFEWIIVDDYSQDNSIDLLTKLQSPGRGGISIYQMPFNSGGGLAASVGIIKSIGKITIIIDQDDELLPDAILKINKYFRKIFYKKEIAAVMFPSIQPISRKKISSLGKGQIFKTSYFLFKEKVTLDCVVAFKGDIARNYYSLHECAKAVLSSAIFLKISKKYFFEYAGGEPILYYHRDNLDSTSNSIRVSNHLIYSFARILDYHDKYYYYRPLKWFRYTMGLIHFSISYYRSPLSSFKFFNRTSTKIWYGLLIPFGVIVHFFKKKMNIIKYGDMDPKICANIIEKL